MPSRFTIDGSLDLEEELNHLCGVVSSGVRRLIPLHKMGAIVLGGGYGRGQGGVLRTENGDHPYNDLEFYIFLNGNRLWNEQKYKGLLHELGERLSSTAGLHVEFKIDSAHRLRRSPISMFSYDLVAAHRVIFGDEQIFQGCNDHLQSEKIPAWEATRLLFNRCTGLLLAREILSRSTVDLEQADFIARNVAKAQLALGDAILTVLGLYHWSCLERHDRLTRLLGSKQHWAAKTPEPPGLVELHQQHCLGVEFKLHPSRAARTRDSLESDHQRVSALALRLWLWLENQRLSKLFGSVREYACNPVAKSPQSWLWRNYLLNLRTFGPRALLDSLSRKYPRERLLNTLPLLLWDNAPAAQPQLAKHFQKQLRTSASDWAGWTAAYKAVWPSYG